MVISNSRIRQIVSEQIQRLTEDNGQVLSNFATYKQEIDDFLAQSSSIYAVDQATKTYLQELGMFMRALSAALGRCIQKQSINEGWKEFWNSREGREGRQEALRGMRRNAPQMSKIPGMLSDMGFKVPSPVNAAVRGYQNGRNWAERWGERYIRNKKRKEVEKQAQERKQAVNNTQQPQQGQPQQQPQQGQPQQPQHQPQQMPSLTMSELNQRWGMMYADYWTIYDNLSQDNQQRLNRILLIINNAFQDYEAAYSQRTPFNP